MIESIIKEQLINNRVLNYKSYKVSCLKFNRFNGDKVIDILSTSEPNYLTIYIKVVAAVNLKIYIDDTLVSNVNDNYDDVISVMVNGKSSLRIVGTSSKLVFKVIGGIFNNCYNEYHLPLLNCLVRDYGSMELVTYSDTDDLLNNNLSTTTAFEEIVSAQVLCHENDSSIGLIIKISECVYYCNNIDNYTRKLLLPTNMKCPVLVPNYEENYDYIVYIKDNNLYCRTIDENYQLSEELEINSPVNTNLISLKQVTYDNYGVSAFLVVVDNNKEFLYSMKNNVFTAIFTFVKPNYAYYLSNNRLYTLCRDGYQLVITKYNFNINLNTPNILNFDSKKIINNVMYGIKNDNDFVFYTDNASWKISENEL